ncbi:SWI/SNF complex subunit SWI3B [Brassica napus]|uniref:SWI/SNF complex subunit SWI3B n=1 Tax=Brassica napus TaxID=3708 RepID=UPI00207AFCE6|nr:SWI/SNF complex subunit SWI3B [Brassica napus]
MATNAPIPGGSGEIPPITPSRPIIPETPSEISASSNSLQPPPSSSDTDRIYIPSYSRWFSWNEINECEVRSLPEFFDSRSSSKNPRVYLYLRNSIIQQYRDEHPQKISFTDVRRTLVGDVVSIRRVFDFLDSWGLINYSSSASAKPLKWDDKEAVASEPPSTVKESAKRICNGCKSVCSVACFASEKYELTLCARCYVRGNYRVGINSSEFKRVELSEESKTGWSEKETLLLLEAVMHYGDDWKKVASHVTGRTEKDCVSQFVKLPFGEQFAKDSDSEDALETFNQIKGSADPESEGRVKDGSSSPDNKRMKLTPLADASNPIMAQAAFLSALAGTKVAEAAARAAVTALSDIDHEAGKNAGGDPNGQEINGNNSERAVAEAKSLLEKEEKEVEGAIREIVEVEMMKIRDRIVHFEKLDLEMERSRKQLEEMKNLLFTDQLNIFFHTRRSRKAEDRAEC